MRAPSRQTLAKCLAAFLGLLLIGWLLYQDSWVRAVVVGQAGRLGTPAVPFLRHALQDENNQVRQAATAALRELGEDAVPSLTEALASADPAIRAEAARALVLVAPKAKNGCRC